MFVIEIVICSLGQKDFYRRVVRSVRTQINCKQGYFISPVVNLFCVEREKAILQSTADWILFLDEDCVLPDSHFLQRLEFLAAKHTQVAIWSGLYMSKKSEGYVTRAYNSLCNFWVLWSRSQNEVLNLLGGCLAIHVPTAKAQLTLGFHKYDHSGFFLKSLQQFKMSCCLSKNLNVLHQPNPQTLQTLWQKAQLHGESRRQYGLKTAVFSSEGFLYAFRNLVYWPIWALHFFAVASNNSQLKPLQSKKIQA